MGKAEKERKRDVEMPTYVPGVIVGARGAGARDKRVIVERVGVLNVLVLIHPHGSDGRRSHVGAVAQAHTVDGPAESLWVENQKEKR